MAAARERVLALLLGLAPVAACAPGGDAVIPAQGRTRADALVAAYAAHARAPGRTLDAHGDVSFGDTGLAYVADEDALYGRVYINNALIDGAPPAELANYRRMVVALNDPRVGGMYDRAGGYFVLDEKRQAYFLVRRFAVPATDPRVLIGAMEAMQQVGARWTTSWLFEVAMVMHGRRPPPDRPVTL